MTTKEAAALLNITARSVARLIGLGLVTATKRGRDWWIEASEVERYKAERRPVGKPKAHERGRDIIEKEESINDGA
jgi:excisionase family DNA binding protein